MSDLIPCAGTVFVLLLIFAFILAMRYLNYMETMKLAEKGLVKPVHKNGNGKGALIWGILITAVGVALTIGMWPLGFMFGTDLPFGFGPWMLAGLIPMFFGIGLLLVYVLTREAKKENLPSKDETAENGKQ